MDSGWSLAEPSHELFPAGQQPPDAVWLGLRKGDELEVGGKSGEGLFDFGIKHRNNGHNGSGIDSSGTHLLL